MSDIYAKPRVVTNLAQCVFYHTTDIPGYGHVKGYWDFRGREREYLGNADFAGKRVLDVGTASGFLSFWMEQHGAEVVAYDLSVNSKDWDIVPFARYNLQSHSENWRKGIGQINDGFWLIHAALKSKVKVVYGSVYEIPVEIGPVDISTFGSILLHVRDPFQALYKASILTREKIIVTDLKPRWHQQTAMYFQPDAKKTEPKETWWSLPPKLIVAFLEVLGFEDTTITYHKQLSQWGQRMFYTVVGCRTVAFQPST